jgi:hypothetical protein
LFSATVGLGSGAGGSLPEHDMDDRDTIRVTALLLAGVFLSCFTLAMASMP